MAESNKKGMISGMDSLVSISGEEYLEVIRLEADGSYKNYKLLVSKIRNNQGLSAYEIAVQNGFVGTVDQWLASLNGKSAYEIAVELGFAGDEAAFILSLKGDKGVAGDEGKSIYDIALANGFIGTEADFLKTLIGKSAYQSALDQGFIGTEVEFVLSLKGEKGDTGDDGEIGPDGKSAFQVWQELPGNAGKPIEDYLEANKGATGDSAYEAALALNPDVGTEAEWLESLVGKSAYEVALAEDPDVGTPAEWLLTLKGDNAYEVAVAEGFVGTEAAWLATLVGKSAYQSWLAAGNVGTESQFLSSLEGSDGNDGAPGESAYEVWKALPGNTDKTEAEFIVAITGKDGTNGTNGTDGEDGLDGKSAYEVWLELPGNAGKPEADFIASIKGAAGEDGEDGAAGKSAYQLWLDAGNTGTNEQFLASLVGADGKQGPGVKVVATIEQDEFDQIVEDGLSEIGDAYLVGVFMYIFNGEEWVKSNAIQGPKGQGLNYLGTWPTGVALPLDSNYKAGDTYVWAAPTKGNSLWTLVVEFDESGVETSRTWVDIGVPGPEGKSAYETWKGLPGNANKTEAEFIASIKGNPGTDGTNGTNGTNGKSAYQIWLDAGNVGNEAAYLLSLKGEQGDVGESAYEVWLAAGNTGTEADYLLAIKGEKGDQGTAAVAFTIKAKLEDVSELPAVGTPTEAYYVKKDLYVWIADSVTPANSKFENFGSLNGASAYEIWVEQPGNAGKTIEEFLASLRGTDGTNGTDGVDGVDGKNLRVLGRRANLAAIQAIPDPQDQDAYTADDAGHLYIYVTNAWVDAGKFRGSDGTNGTNGTDGEDGKSAYEIAQDGGFVGSESAWLVSLKGTDGTDGRNVQLKGAVADVASLPAGAAEQDAYSVTETNTVYMWISGAWVNLGSFRGTNGTNGKSAYQTWLDAGNVGTEAQFLASLKGTNGTNGTDGEDGADGRNVTVLGSKATLAIIQALPTPAQQDAWTSLEDGHLYMYIGTAWVDLGRFKGDKGDTGDDGLQGATGTSINIKGEVELDADLPDPGTLSVGDSYFSLESRKLYQVNEGGLYNPGINITGPQGEEGPEGKQGETGTSIKIMGTYATEAALLAADPAQTPGDGYLVGADLYLPAANGVTPKWYNAGPVRGPIGPEGKIGKTGLKGNTGNTGERGSLWLTLEAGLTEPRPDYGRDGDWAVSESFETFYKAPGTGWAPIGRLVAGDVNSPPGSAGKVVRMGTQWVPLPVDEVPNLATGKVYARQLKAGGEVGEGEWVEIVFPDTFPETLADGKQYVRTRETGQEKGVWEELVFPPSIPDLTTKDGKQMVRVYEVAGSTPIWKELSVPAAGIPEAPTTAGKLYLRSGQNNAWVEYVAGISAPADAKKYLRTATDWVAFDAYDVANQNAAAASTATSFDVSKSQLLDLLNTSSGVNKTITFSGVPGAGRSTTAVVLVSGSSATVSFALPAGAPAGSVLKWNGGTDPVFQAGFNVLTFLIVVNAAGVIRIIGAVGSQTPTLT